MIQPLRFPADNADQMHVVFFHRHQTREFLDGADHSGQRLPDFMGDSGGEPAKSGHAFLGSDFLFQPSKIGEVLKVVDEAAAMGIARAQRRNTDAEIAELTFAGPELDFAPQRKLVGRPGACPAPESLVDFGNLFPAEVHEAISENVLARTVEQNDPAFNVGSDQAAAHRMNDVFGEILEIEQLFAFLFELQTFATQRLREKTGEVGDREEAEEVAEEPESQTVRSRGAL